MFYIRRLFYIRRMPLSDANEFLSLMQIHMKNPEFGKVLEQKLFRIVDLVGFDFSTSRVEQF